MGFIRLSLRTEIISLNNINKPIFVMEKCWVFSEVRTDFLNIIYMNFGFKGLP
jgi:hypothetical protein